MRRRLGPFVEKKRRDRFGSCLKPEWRRMNLSLPELERRRGLNLFHKVEKRRAHDPHLKRKRRRRFGSILGREMRLGNFYLRELERRQGIAPTWNRRRGVPLALCWSGIRGMGIPIS